jgi:hypothetical protein
MTECTANTTATAAPTSIIWNRRLAAERPSGQKDLNHKPRANESIEFQAKLSQKFNSNSEHESRDSGKAAGRGKQRFNLEELKVQVRCELQKMSYQENLIQAEYLFKTVKELCRSYGYFSVTEAMLHFNFG